MRNLKSTEVLPLIEFQLEEGISDEEAIRLLQSTNEDSINKQSATDHSDNNFQALFIDDSAQNIADPFTATLINLEVNLKSADMYSNCVRE